MFRTVLLSLAIGSTALAESADIVSVRSSVTTLGSLSGVLQWEHALSPHFSLASGLGARAQLRDGINRMHATVEVGVHWYPAERLQGLFLGLHVPIGLNYVPGSVVGIGGLGGLSQPRPHIVTASVGLSLLAGWTFRFERGLSLQIAAGPTAGVEDLFVPNTAPLLVFDLRTQLAFGVAL